MRLSMKRFQYFRELNLNKRFALPSTFELARGLCVLLKMGLCVFNDEWIIEYPWIRRDARSVHHAYCQLCHKTFSIGGQGVAAVKSHSLNKNLEDFQ